LAADASASASTEFSDLLWTQADGEEEEDVSLYPAEVTQAVNAERKNRGLRLLTTEPALDAAAMARAEELREVFAHYRPNGTIFSTVFLDYKVRSTRGGENIAMGQTDPAAVMDSWMNSKQHRDNILSENFSRIGVGFFEASDGVRYWVQVFAS
jgi:uncharacterized protein YkwD